VHLHHGALRILRDIVNIVLEFITEHQDLCKGCALGMYNKTPFPINDNREIGILNVTHFDVCGMMYSASLTGCLCYLIFIDEFS